MELTDKERQEYREKEKRERAARLACWRCQTVMVFVATLDQGNDQGWGQVHLFQCPECKTVDTRDRTT